jgi:hypothetical protein
MHSFNRSLAVTISAILVCTLILNFQSAEAECLRDEDWPEKPCYDSGTPSKSELKQVWEEYYKLKGKDWMEIKKAEMDKAVENKTLNTWLERDFGNNFANHNVYSYYLVNDQAPSNISDFSSSEELDLYQRSQWYVSPAGISIIGGLAIAGSLASFYLFRKAKQK